MKALPEDTHLYLAHRKSAEGRSNVLEMGSWSGAAVKSAGPGGSEETRDESQESDVEGAADVDGNPAKENVSRSLPSLDDGRLYAEAVGLYVVAIRWPSLAKVEAVEDEGLRRDYARVVEFLRQRRTPYGLLHDLRAVRSIEKLSPIAQGLLDDALELQRTGLMLRVAVLHSVGGVVGNAYIPLLLKLSPIHPAIAFRAEQADEALRWVADEDRPRMATSMHGTDDGNAHDGFAGIQSAWQKRIAEPVQGFGQSLAKAIENAPVAFERHVAEPVQEFSQNLAKGVSEHVTEPVHEFGQSFAKGMDEHVAKPVRNFSGEVGEGLEKFVRELAPKPVPEADLERLVRQASAVLVSSAPGTAKEPAVAIFPASATTPEKVTLSFHGPTTLASAGLVSAEDAKIGAIVQVFWAEGIWYDATIVDVARGEDGSVDVKLHYKGFGKRYDDWQPLHEGSVRWPLTGYDLSRDGESTSVKSLLSTA